MKEQRMIREMLYVCVCAYVEIAIVGLLKKSSQ